MTKRIPAVVLILLVASAARAADWPEFRGPTGQGHVEGGLPLAWSKTQNVVWTQAIPGKGWSSPVVVAGRIYLTTSVPVPNSKDQLLEALCLDAETGKVLWEKEVFRQDGAKAPRIHGKNSHASPTALVRDQKLFVHYGHQGTACLDLDGKVLWKNADLSYSPVHGNGGSPILVDNALVFSGDGSNKQFVVALDVNTGKVLWQTERKTPAIKKFSFSTPLLITVNGVRQIISPASDMVGAYDTKTGQELWRATYIGYSVIPRPVFGHGMVFILTGYDVPSLMAIRADGNGDVTKTHVAWTTKKAVPHSPSLLLVGDELYMISDRGIASCLDARTGKVNWEERIGGNYSASPVDADGRVYFQSEEGTTTVVQAGKEYKPLAKNVLGERTLASFAAVNGVLYLRSEENLYRIQEKKP